MHNHELGILPFSDWAHTVHSVFFEEPNALCAPSVKGISDAHRRSELNQFDALSENSLIGLWYLRVNSPYIQERA